jgi:hypothetical protein
MNGARSAIAAVSHGGRECRRILREYSSTVILAVTLAIAYTKNMRSILSLRQPPISSRLGMRYAPNKEDYCMLQCGCIMLPWGAVHKLGEFKNGKKCWRLPCQFTGDAQVIVAFGIRYYSDGGKCSERDTANGRLF